MEGDAPAVLARCLRVVPQRDEGARYPSRNEPLLPTRSQYSQGAEPVLSGAEGAVPCYPARERRAITQTVPASRNVWWLWLVAVAAVLALPPFALAQSAERNGWVEEPGAKVEGQPGRAYLDPASVHRGADGMVYFNESTGVTRTEDAGKVGIMLDAYDCAKNIKYMCVGYGNWRTDAKSTVDAAREPALPVYRHFLCADESAHADSTKSK